MKNKLFILVSVLFFTLSAQSIAQTSDSAVSTATSTALAPAEPGSNPLPSTAVSTSTTIDDTASLDQVLDATVTLVKTGKSMGSLALAVAVINLLILMMKTSYAGELFTKANPAIKRVILLALGQVAGILMAMAAGTGAMSAVIGGLVSSGGAVAIFEAVKPLLPAKYQTLL